MSSLVVDRKKEEGYLRDGVFAYVCIDTPTLKYQEKVKKEFKVSFVVDEDTADLWEESFPKNKARKVKTSDFEDHFKMKPVFPDEKNQYIITVKSDAFFKSDWKEFKEGDALPKNMGPRVYEPAADGKVREITHEKLVGNGSKGDIRFTINTNDYGSFPQLKAILVSELVPYERKINTGFGELVDDEPAAEVPDVPEAGSNGKDDDSPF